MREARSIGTTTDAITAGEVRKQNMVLQSTPMHDAHLKSNGEVTEDGFRVTDFIVELRDDCRSRSHFMPCPRNTKGIYT